MMPRCHNASRLCALATCPWSPLLRLPLRHRSRATSRSVDVDGVLLGLLVDRAEQCTPHTGLERRLERRATHDARAARRAVTDEGMVVVVRGRMVVGGKRSMQEVDARSCAMQEVVARGRCKKRLWQEVDARRGCGKRSWCGFGIAAHCFPGLLPRVLLLGLGLGKEVGSRISGTVESRRPLRYLHVCACMHVCMSDPCGRCGQGDETLRGMEVGVEREGLAVRD